MNDLGMVFIGESLTCHLNNLTTTLCIYSHVLEMGPNLQEYNVMGVERLKVGDVAVMDLAVC